MVAMYSISAAPSSSKYGAESTASTGLSFEEAEASARRSTWASAGSEKSTLPSKSKFSGNLHDVAHRATTAELDEHRAPDGDIIHFFGDDVGVGTNPTPGSVCPKTTETVRMHFLPNNRGGLNEKRPSGRSRKGA